MRGVGFLAYLDTLENPEDRKQNVQELLNSAAEYEEGEPEGGVVGFLERAALISDVDALEDGEGSAALMTLHCAKGLEFDHVFIVGLEEGLLPFIRDQETEDIEEERRLCFVGMTRARKRLWLTYAVTRTRYGRTGYARPSRFLDEIPEDAVTRERTAGAPAATRPRPRTPLVRRKPRPPATLTADDPFKAGDLVRHAKFGVGRVLGLSGFGEQRRVMVQFDTAGVKTLMLAIAKLEKVG